MLNRSLRVVVVALAAGFVGAAVGTIHKTLASQDLKDLSNRVDRLLPVRAAPASASAPGRLNDLARVGDAPVVALPKPPPPPSPKEPAPKPVEPDIDIARLPERLLNRPVSAPPTDPARTPLPVPSPGKVPPPSALGSADGQIGSFLAAARKAVDAGAFSEARAQAAKASGLPGPAERLAEAKRLESLAALCEKLLPEADRWKDVYASGWISIRLRSFGKVVEGRDLGETGTGYVVGRRNSRQTIPKTEADKVERLYASQARARFEAEAWVMAEEAGEDESRAGNLLSAVKFAWEMNLPATALEILGQAADEDPSIASATGIPSIPRPQGPGSLAIVSLDSPEPDEPAPPEPEGSVEEPAAPEPVQTEEPSPQIPAKTPEEPSAKTEKPLPRKTGRETPKGSGGPRSGSLSKAASLVNAGTNARHAGNRDESLRVYDEALGILKPMLSGPERREALLELARAEHGIASVYLVRKDWATAYMHYKNSAYYLEIGNYPIKLQTSGNLQRIQQMKTVLGGKVPDWKPPV